MDSYKSKFDEASAAAYCMAMGKQQHKNKDSSADKLSYCLSVSTDKQPPPCLSTPALTVKRVSYDTFRGIITYVFTDS